jgi:aspartyl-tRNA(Asn)/glutamyl-tRNA(Gln) amidotransferase subunit C
MPSISIDVVRDVARLARLGLTDERARALMADLNDILGHMEVLARVDTTGVREHSATDAAMPVRADRGPPIPLSAPPAAFAPEMRDGFFVVPRLAAHRDAEP